MIKAKRYYFCKIKLEKLKTLFYPDRKINSPEKVFDLVKDIIGNSDREELLVISLNVKNEINGINISSIGTIDSSIAEPKEILKFCLLTNASNFIICHNHPSGHPEPSKQDISFTERINESSKIIGIKLIDHIIIGDETFYSFKEKGNL